MREGPPRQRVSILTRAFARVQRRLASSCWGRRKRFNPHSSFRPSATIEALFARPYVVVSILTRAFARVQRTGGIRFLKAEEVSILTRAFARVQHDGGGTLGSIHLSVSILTRAFARVQHSLNAPARINAGVSILTRAFARVQPSDTGGSVSAKPFQSSLELSPECNLWSDSGPAVGLKFQSSLELSPECNSITSSI